MPTETEQNKVAEVLPRWKVINFSPLAPEKSGNARARFDLRVGPIHLLGCLLIQKQDSNDFWISAQSRTLGSAGDKRYSPTARLETEFASQVTAAAVRLFRATEAQDGDAAA